MTGAVAAVDLATVDLMDPAWFADDPQRFDVTQASPTTRHLSSAWAHGLVSLPVRYAPGPRVG